MIDCIQALANEINRRGKFHAEVDGHGVMKITYPGHDERCPTCGTKRYVAGAIVIERVLLNVETQTVTAGNGGCVGTGEAESWLLSLHGESKSLMFGVATPSGGSESLWNSSNNSGTSFREQ